MMVKRKKFCRNWQKESDEENVIKISVLREEKRRRKSCNLIMKIYREKLIEKVYN
jgi:hypothetical protein